MDPHTARPGRHDLNLIKTMFATTLGLWLTQVVLFGVLFVSWFILFIVRWLIGFGSPVPESSWQSFLFKVMRVLSYPLGWFLPDRPGGDDTVTMILRWGANSAIWGMALGAFIYIFQKLRRNPPDAGGQK